MGRDRRTIEVSAGDAPPSGSPVCLAPAMMIYFDPSGDLRPCCKNHVALGNIGRTRLPDIWWGDNRRVLEGRLEQLDFSLGCVQCAAEVVAEGRSLAYPSNFDKFGPLLAPERADRWPLRMEFNLSNACNLQCIQCNGLLSSSIRIHRERRPPLPKLYGEQFFEDLEAFIPHLEEAQFAGGEPFMGEENYRVWEMIARLKPDLRCSTVTNATQWNTRVEKVIEALQMEFVFSIDGVTKETYEAVRIGADFESVMRNVDRYRKVASANELPSAVNYCHMSQNYRGLPDVLRWAEEREMFVNVSVVRDPAHCSLAAESDEVLRDALTCYESQYEAVAADLVLNRATWDEEVNRVRRWLDAGEGGRFDLWGEPNYVIERRHTRAVRALTLFTTRIREGTSYFECVSGGDGRVVEVNEPFARLAGLAPDDARGQDTREFLLGTLAKAFGSTPQVETLLDTAECVECDVTVGDRLVRLLRIPTPGLDGWDVTTTVVLAEIDPRWRAQPFEKASDWNPYG